MVITNSRLSEILDRCMESLILTTDISSDFTNPVEDYSYEYLFNDMLYEIASFDRIITHFVHDKTFEKEIESIYLIYKRCFDYSNDDFVYKLNKYQEAYFSTGNMLEEIEEIEYRLPFINDHETEISITDSLFDILEKKDAALMFSKKGGITQKIAYKYFDFSLYDDFLKQAEEIFTIKSGIFKTLSNYIVGFRRENLIPNIKEYSWWYDFQSITLDNFILSLESNAFQNKSLALFLNKKLKDLALRDKLEHSVKDTLVYARKVSKKLNDIIDESFVPDIASSETVPAVWGKRQQIGIPDLDPMHSDHEMDERFYDNFAVNKQAIRQAIEVIEADDIGEQKRKETIAILYLMLNEHGEALKRLDED